MDRITRSYIQEFRTEQDLPDKVDEATAFEHLATYCNVVASYDEEFELDLVHVGGGQDLGIDGAAILVNGALISTPEEVDDLLKISGALDVKFIFVQAKSSGSFESEEIAAFCDGVSEFFSEAPMLPVNADIAGARDVMNRIYDNSTKFKARKPNVEMYFVTTGKWQNDAYLTVVISKKRDALIATQLFDDVKFVPMGANEIQAAYQRSKNNVTVEFQFASRVLLPDIHGVSQAYLGVIPASEFMKLITDDEGGIRKSLFNDNVRDYQGENEVNLEIAETLKEGGGRQRFAVLNNGVTIVTRQLTTTANKFAISDYQIVNGCQTSHVLFEHRDLLDDAIFVPVKVISSPDEDLINSIVQATNRQTEVTDEDLFAMSSFQKKLEAFYNSFTGKKKLWYERRSRQYAAATGVEKVRVVGKTQQIRSFAAMYLDEPHRAARYYSDLRAQVGDKIFGRDHVLEPYYTSSYAFYRLDYLFRNQVIPVYYKPARYHILMAYRYLVDADDMPAFTANKMAKYSNAIMETLWDDAKSLEMFRECIEVVDEALAGVALDRDVVKPQAFTGAVRTKAKLRSQG